jgi:type IV secretory pathway VirB2 component (pilin)
MMVSTKIFIAFAVMASFLTIMAFATSPDHIESGISIRDQTFTAIMFQIFGILCAIVSIISILITGLKKAFGKKKY